MSPLALEALRRNDGDPVGAILWLTHCWRSRMDAVDAALCLTASNELTASMNDAERTTLLTFMERTATHLVPAVEGRHHHRSLTKQLEYAA